MNNLEQNWIKVFDKPLAIAGPCSAESEEQMLTIAKQLNKDYIQVFRAGIWKPRTKPNCFEGVGKIGLNWLKKVKEEYGFLTTTEVANVNHVELALENDVDILWIGARTTVNPFLIQEIAEALKGSDKVVLVKNPINPDLQLWIGAFERLVGQGITQLGAIHRGFSTYKKSIYRNQPQWQIALDFKEKYPNIPMICDPSHIAGNRELIFDISQKAFNFGFHGLMIEAHHNPDKAWSDAKQQITPDELLSILKKLEIRNSNDLDVSYSQKLEALRNVIDDNDKEVMETLAKRMEIAKKIGELKKEHNVTIFQPERWVKIKNLMIDNAVTHGLSKEFVEQYLAAVHQESIRVQNKVMNE